jgi:hypothetical protein
MEFLKELFGEEALTYEQLLAKVNEKGLKVADLSTGKYVDKKKYEDEVSTKDTSIKDLQEQIKTRDKDLKALQSQLSDGNKDNETKISELTAQVTKLQGDYKNATSEYEKKLSAQAYNFAVREYAGGRKFTSEAAKRDFINEMISANLQMKDNALVGADIFEASYKANNADAFVVEEEKKPEDEKKPIIIKPSAPTGAKQDENPFLSAFGFQPK